MSQLKFEDALAVTNVIALWLAIHGGDPGPGERMVSKEEAAATAAKIIAALSPIAEASRSFEAAAEKLPNQSTDQMVRNLNGLGIDVHVHQGDKRVELAAAPFDGPSPWRICPCFGPPNHRKCYCVNLQSL